MAIDEYSFQGGSSLNPNDVSEAIDVHQIHDNVPLKVVERFIIFSPYNTPIDGNDHYILNDVSEGMHVHQIHDNVPWEVVESVNMGFSIQLLVTCEIVWDITPIEGNQ
jgi:hypothetical protein